MTTARETWCFGPFRLDPMARVLFRDGKPVAMPPKQVDTLVALVREHGQVVERERLMNEVWPGTFVEEGGLTRNISAIRKALEDLGTDPIETVPKRGYRFVAAVHKELARPDVVQPVVLGGRSALRSWWVRVVALVAIGAVLAIVAMARRPTPPTPVKSLAVLPFQLLSDDGRDKYLAVGLADLLTTRLSGMATLSVRAASSAAHLGASDPVAAGKALGVDAVIHGTLRRSGDRLRLTVQIIDVASGTPLYAGSFDERADALLALEVALTDSVTGLLIPRLVPAERAARARAGTWNQGALDAYLHGRYLLATREPANVETAIAAFDQSRQLDPSFALAYAGLSHAYIIQGDYQYKWPRDVFPKAKAAAIRAIELDGSLADAHAALGEIAWQYDWDWTTAEQSLRRAADLAPNDPTVHQWLAEYYNAMGRDAESQTEIDLAVSLAPRDFAPAAIRAQLHYWSHRFDDAVALTDHALALQGFDVPPLTYKHFSLYQGGRLPEARAFWATFADRLKGLPIHEATTAVYEWRDGHRTAAESRLRRLVSRRGSEYIDGIFIASVYAERGDATAAVRWLNQAVQDHSILVPLIVHDPFYDRLHGDAPFRALVTGIGLGHLLH